MITSFSCARALTLVAGFCVVASACSSSNSTPASASGGASDGGADSGDTGKTAGDGGADAVDSGNVVHDGGGAGGATSLQGTYGADAIKPIVAAYWVGMPGDPTESAGGPFVYLFSTPVTCDDISKDAWAPSLPAGTQALEMIVGVTKTNTPAAVSSSPGANLVEANYFGPTGPETRAKSGSVSLTSYTKDVAVDGTLDLTFPAGTAKGTFHAVWCPTGHER